MINQNYLESKDAPRTPSAREKYKSKSSAQKMQLQLSQSKFNIDSVNVEQ